MRAIINEKYGSPDILYLKEIQKPKPRDKEVLIKVRAASVNKADWFMLNGQPFPVRIAAGLLKPNFQTLGADIAGVIEIVGKDVEQFKVGDEVYGDLSGIGFGGFAEYAIAKENILAKKPSNLSFEEAAALPMASLTALQGLRKAMIREGQKILINGASGGVGGFAIQIAKAFDTEVTAVCSSSKADLAIKQGADHVIDYKNEDFTEKPEQYDLIFDVIANHTMSEINRVLKKGGSYVTCAFSPAVMFFGALKSIATGKKFSGMLANVNQADLEFISKLAEEGHLKPHIQQSFRLEDVPEALKIMGKGGMSGKLVISI